MRYRCASGWIISAVVLLSSAFVFASPATAPSTVAPPTPAAPTLVPPAFPAKNAAIVVLRGEVDEFERTSIERRFAEARAAGADTVIVQINTYGGLVTSGLEISEFIKRQSDLHTIAFVDEKAISAGAMIAMACDEIIMDPAAKIGDCAPIIFKSDGGIDSMGATERAKAQSPVMADFLDSAQRNHHNTLLAEAMVALDHVIHFVQSPTGEKRLVNEKDYQSLVKDGWKPVEGVSDPVNASDSLLTLNTGPAVAVGLANGQAATPQALAAQRGITIVGTFSPGSGEKFVELLSNPLSRMLLIVIFMASLQIALSAPGHGAAEAIALISLGLLVGMPLLTGYAKWWEVVLIFTGLALIAFEVFVFPGHMVSAIIGGMMALIGLVLTFVGSDPGAPSWLPQTQQAYSLIQQGLIAVTGSLAASLVLWLWLARYLPKIPYFNKLVLNATTGGSQAVATAPTAPEPCWPPVGCRGIATTDLRPGGSASFPDGVMGDTQTVAVVSESGYVSAGTSLQVRESRGNRVVVRSIS